MPGDKPGNFVDGRRLRTERSRQVIVDAMMGLIDEGLLRPTAEQVAERSGVGVRTVYRRFIDMETLFVEADKVGQSRYDGIFAGGDREGDLEERLQHAMEQRAAAYSAARNMLQAGRAQMWQYDIIRQQYRRIRRRLREDLEDWLPELKSLSAERREMVDLVTSPESWNGLREDQGLSKKRSITLLVNLLRELIESEIGHG